MKKFVLTEEDYRISAGLSYIKKFSPMISFLKQQNIDSIVDCGCGYGAMARIFADKLNVTDVTGVDCDSERLKVAKDRIKVVNLDLEKDKLPFNDCSISLVLSFGAIEHLCFYDNFLSEVRKVLKPNGFFILSFPNLRNWTNLGSLLLGFQPPDVEVSQNVRTGVMPFFVKHNVGHVHSTTFKCMKGLLDYYGFKIIQKDFHGSDNNKFLYNLVDKVVPYGFRRRFLLLCQKRLK